MFETLDVMISVSVIFLILSMAHKYLMSFLKRFLKIKGKIVAREMKIFVGKNTTEYLIPYLEKKAAYLNFTEDSGVIFEDRGFRHLSHEQLSEALTKLNDFIKDKSVEDVRGDLDLNNNSAENIKETFIGIKKHLNKLSDKIDGKLEKMYDNTANKISDCYEKKMRNWTLVFGLALAVAMNADFFYIHKSMSENSIARSTLVVHADQIDLRMQQISEEMKNVDEEGSEDLAGFCVDTKESFESYNDEIKKAGLNLGWSKNEWCSGTDSLLSAIGKIIGLFISGLLISFGAPFWHEFLSVVSGMKKMKGSMN